MVKIQFIPSFKKKQLIKSVAQEVKKELLKLKKSFKNIVFVDIITFNIEKKYPSKLKLFTQKALISFSYYGKISLILADSITPRKYIEFLENAIIENAMPIHQMTPILCQKRDQINSSKEVKNWLKKNFIPSVRIPPLVSELQISEKIGFMLKQYVNDYLSKKDKTKKNLTNAINFSWNNLRRNMIRKELRCLKNKLNL